MAEPVSYVAAADSISIDEYAGGAGRGGRGGDPSRPDARPPQKDPWPCDVIEPSASGAGGVGEGLWIAVEPAGRADSQLLLVLEPGPLGVAGIHAAGGIRSQVIRSRSAAGSARQQVARHQDT